MVSYPQSHRVIIIKRITVGVFVQIPHRVIGVSCGISTGEPSNPRRIGAIAVVHGSALRGKGGEGAAGVGVSIVKELGVCGNAAGACVRVRLRPCIWCKAFTKRRIVICICKGTGGVGQAPNRSETVAVVEGHRRCGAGRAVGLRVAGLREVAIESRRDVGASVADGAAQEQHRHEHEQKIKLSHGEGLPAY